MNIRSRFQSMEHFRLSVNAMQPGEALMYHRGNLATDRRMMRLVNEIADYVLTLGTGAGVKVRHDYPGLPAAPLGTGFGQLFQKRVDEGRGQIVYEYYLRRKPR